MSDHRELSRRLLRIDGKGYKAYKDITGAYRFPGFSLFVDHVQQDPYAPPSRFRVRVPAELSQFPPPLFTTKVRRVALQDFLTRRLAASLENYSRERGGGFIVIDKGGQEILERTAMLVTASFVEARISVGLPARGRRILGRQAEALLCGFLPRAVEEALLFTALEEQALLRHLQVAEDQEALRAQLPREGLVAFIANGSLLPRRSGVSDLPLPAGKAIPFKSPSSLERELETPNAGSIRGMGIPRGVTLIVGGGYHGKSTLLRAVERGIYNHVPGDGREGVVTLPEAVKIRAEDRRRVEGVDISPFINNLPFGDDTTFFSTEEASGSTSQAANIMEYLEGGASVLLLDEDTSATNFMIRDARMQALVAREKEPITPFIDKVRLLYRDLGVSTILVIGGSGDYFDVADTVIMMEEYSPREVTARSREIAAALRGNRRPEGGESFGTVPRRIPLPRSLDPVSRDKVNIKARGRHELVYGQSAVSLSLVEQLVDPSQVRAIGDIIGYLARRYVDGRRALKDGVALAFGDISREGLDLISPYYGRHPGDYALPRPLEVIAAINRLPTLQVKRALPSMNTRSEAHEGDNPGRCPPAPKSSDLYYQGQ